MRRFLIRCDNTVENIDRATELMKVFFSLFKEAKGKFSSIDEKIVLSFSIEEDDPNFDAFLIEIENRDFNVEEMPKTGTRNVWLSVQKEVDIPELNQMACYSSNYQEFLDDFFERINVNKSSSLLMKEIVLAACELDIVSYGGLFQKLDYTETKIKYCIIHVVQNFRIFYPQYQFIMPLQMVKILRRYKNFEFGVKPKQENDVVDDLEMKELQNKYLICFKDISAIGDALKYISSNNMTSFSIIEYIISIMELGVVNPYKNFFVMIAREAVNLSGYVDVENIIKKLNYETYIEYEFEVFLKAFLKRNGLRKKISLRIFLNEMRILCCDFSSEM